MGRNNLDQLQAEWDAEFSYGPTHLIKQRIVHQILKPLRGLRILDLGCGGGGYTRLLEQENRVVATDLSHLSVTKTNSSRSAPGMSLASQILELPFKNNSFDAVVAFDVLEHIEQDDKAVEEILRVLKPGGRLLFVVPEDMRLYSAIDEANGHFRRYNIAGIRTLLKDFNLTYLSDFGFPLMRIYLKLFAKRLLAIRAKSPDSSPTLMVRLLSPLIVAFFHLDRLFNGSFRGVEIFGIAQKP